MRIDPAIAALQRDPELQRQAQQAMIEACHTWRALPEVAPLVAELDSYGTGAALEECPALEAAFTTAQGAAAAAASLVRQFSTLLVQQQFGQVPFRHAFDGEVSTLLLVRSGRAQIVLHAREPGEWNHDQAGFSAGERYEAVLAGAATAQIVRRATPAAGHPLHAERIELQPGARIALHLAEEALQLRRVDQRLVALRLNRFAADPGPTRHHALADGRLLHQSAGSLVSSRQEMMLAILGRMKRTDAAPAMADLALDKAADESLRWQALRKCLALDSGAGFIALATVASDAADPLAAPAGALRARLIESHPQLLQLEDARCPA
ncbi:MAG: hypothetical protein WA842_04130 [Croceibacterium sp.]